MELLESMWLLWENKHGRKQGSPSLINPKKNWVARFIVDFPKVNEQLIHKPYPQKLFDMLINVELFQYAPPLDIKMRCYDIRLDVESQKIIRVLQWENNSWLWFPMDISVSPDICQEGMFDILQQLEYVEVYVCNHLEQQRLMVTSYWSSTMSKWSTHALHRANV